MKARHLRHLMNLWPPFLFSGIRVTALSDDWRHAQVRLRSGLLNRNYVGTHFGGSLFAMTDPFWMILVMENLGRRDYVVWDKAGEIDFIAPARGEIRARFDLDDAVLAQFRRACAGGDKYLHWFQTDLVDRQDRVVARVRKQIYARRKPAPESGQAEPATDPTRVPD
ncbi:MAG: DUF4442 domain-containing protein [Xanthomonadales bacterium]|nr:DUF4442 domain-containing protein [Xanthomonadales bacterium]